MAPKTKIIISTSIIGVLIFGSITLRAKAEQKPVLTSSVSNLVTTPVSPKVNSVTISGTVEEQITYWQTGNQVTVGTNLTNGASLFNKDIVDRLLKPSQKAFKADNDYIISANI